MLLALSGCTDGAVMAGGNCTTSASCADGLLCDLSTGRCVQCVSDANCDLGQSCRRNICVGADGSTETGSSEATDQGDETATGTATVATPRCGDGVVEGSEECDDGLGNDNGAGEGGCRTDCTRVVCHQEEAGAPGDPEDGLVGAVYSSRSMHLASTTNCTVPTCADPGGIDAVALKHELGGEQKLSSVHVLVAVPLASWASYPSGAQLSVLVWNGKDPNKVTPARVTQTFVPATSVRSAGLQNYDAISAHGDECQQDTDCTEGKLCSSEMCLPGYRLSWWRFDFSAQDVRVGADYVVGVEWLNDSGYPLVVASEKNHSCATNWSDYNRKGVTTLKQGQPGNLCMVPTVSPRLGTVTMTQVCE